MTKATMMLPALLFLALKVSVSGGFILHAKGQGFRHSRAQVNKERGGRLEPEGGRQDTWRVSEVEQNGQGVSSCLLGTQECDGEGYGDRMGETLGEDKKGCEKRC